MRSSSRAVPVLVWGFLASVIVAIFVAYGFERSRIPHTLLPVIGPVADFALTNQAGRQFTLADLRGHVWVADIIFTRCPGPCARMTQQMKALQSALPRNSSARLVTLTADSAFDIPLVLKAHADRTGADVRRWMFLTGSKKEITALAVDSLKLTTIEKKPDERENLDDLFIHSTIFVVVDKQARLRGVFETVGEEIDAAKVRQEILAAIRQLEHER